MSYWDNKSGDPPPFRPSSPPHGPRTTLPTIWSKVKMLVIRDTMVKHVAVSSGARAYREEQAKQNGSATFSTTHRPSQTIHVHDCGRTYNHSSKSRRPMLLPLPLSLPLVPPPPVILVLVMRWLGTMFGVHTHQHRLSTSGPGLMHPSRWTRSS